MAVEPLSASARRFLVEEIRSVMQLELVLLLHRDGDRCWSAATASRELRAPQPWVEEQLQGLVAQGLLEVTRHDDPLYRFDRAQRSPPPSTRSRCASRNGGRASSR